jgi:hypothetical protein
VIIKFKKSNRNRRHAQGHTGGDEHGTGLLSRVILRFDERL